LSDQQIETEEINKKRLIKPVFVPPVHVPLSKGVIIVDEEHCTCCMHCVHACSLTNEGVCSHELARIQLAESTNYIFENSAKPCLQCVDPQCLRYCPTGAIKVDAATGARIIEQKFCIGCQNCIEKCPYDPPRISFNKAKKKAVKCDLCGGDPACVKACSHGALTYFTDPNGVQTGYIQPKGSV